MQSAAESEAGFRDIDGLGALLVLAQTLPLALRRVAPLGSLAAITAAIGVHAALGYDHIQPGTLASLFAVGSAAYLTNNRRTVVAGLIMAAGIGVFYATTRIPVKPSDVIVTSSLWSARMDNGICLSYPPEAHCLRREACGGFWSKTVRHAPGKRRSPMSGPASLGSCMISLGIRLTSSSSRQVPHERFSSLNPTRRLNP